MTYEIRQAYTEVYEVLESMPREYKLKLPNRIVDLLKTSKLDNYKIDIDRQNPIDSTKLSKQAMTILAILNYQYWCPSRIVKDDLYKIYFQNEENHQKELREKYNPDDIFKKKKEKMQETENVQAEETSMVVYQEEKWYKKIFNIIKGIFTKK